MHQVVVSTVSFVGSHLGGGSRNYNNGRVKGNNDDRHHNRNNKGRNLKGGNKNYNNSSRQNDSSSRSILITTVSGSSDVSFSSIYCTSTLDTHHLSAGTN